MRSSTSPQRASGPISGAILEEAAGNPLALIELPAAAAELGSRAEQSGPLPLTARLEQTFASRLTTLDTDVQRLLLLAALDDLDLAELSRAARTLLGPEDLAPAVVAGLGTLDSGGFRFRHPLIVSAVKQAAMTDQLRSAHAALAEVRDGRIARLYTLLTAEG
jgi:hypothetical protein